MTNKNTKDGGERRSDTSSASYIAEIGRLQARLSELSGEVAQLRAELSQRRGVKVALGNLYRAVDTAITRRIETRGYRRKPQRRATPSPIRPEVWESVDMVTLTFAARQYDAVAYFRPKASAATMRLRYRIMRGTYTAMRNLGVATAKGMYRAVRRGAK